MVIVRPDQYVAKVLHMDDGSGIEEFFAGCLLEQQQLVNGPSQH